MIENLNTTGVAADLAAVLVRINAEGAWYEKFSSKVRTCYYGEVGNRKEQIPRDVISRYFGRTPTLRYPDGSQEKVGRIEVTGVVSKKDSLRRYVCNRNPKSMAGAKERRCMMCRKQFDSLGAWNRRCQKCESSLSSFSIGTPPMRVGIRSGSCIGD